MSPPRKSAAFPGMAGDLRRDWFAAPLTAKDGYEMLDRAVMWLARWATEAKYLQPQPDMAAHQELIDTAAELAWLQHSGRRAPLLHGLGDKR